VSLVIQLAPVPKLARQTENLPPIFGKTCAKGYNYLMQLPPENVVLVQLDVILQDTLAAEYP
jgi:hypothetical protein